ncbi:MAG TPA: hypothetical protein VE621_04955 [Bryobacteraceae bacterium]|nr:hypothetical protein [Bryobacteraceae bacterium]
MNEQKLYVTFSDDLKTILQDSDKDIKTAIEQQFRKEGIVAEVQLASDPTKVEEDKELIVLIILASGVTATLAGIAVKNVIEALAHRDSINQTKKELRVALDGNGNPIYKANGDPAYEAFETPLEAPTATPSEAKLDAGMIHYSLKSGEAARTS